MSAGRIILIIILVLVLLNVIGLLLFGCGTGGSERGNILG